MSSDSQAPLPAAPDAQYAIGIDLGTTHCALSYVDLDLSEGEAVSQFTLSIPQLVEPGEIDARELLSSFLYLPHSAEVQPSQLRLAWQGADETPSFAAGELAHRRAASTPLRTVSSAKSWLGHAGVDRRAPLLPLGAPEDVAKISPVEASRLYLAHLRDAWNERHPEAPFEEQLVTITVPASFDPAAREFTAEAAKAAGYQHVTLLEEPQAALYSWVQKSQGAFRDQVKVGDLILVVDVGGGTTDFSLVAVGESDGELTLERVAVGDHVLLGGDNMDLALAYVLKQKLAGEGKSLDEWQLRSLGYACRRAKEQLLSDSSVASVPIAVPSRGSKLIGSTLRTELTRAEVEATLVEGFFPRCAVTDAPKSRARAALTQMSLPYAQDPAVTRHMAAFLHGQAGWSGGQQSGLARPTAVLFNGGVFKAEALRRRVVETLNAWLFAGSDGEVRELSGADLDLACARGAGYYGYVRRGTGIRIRGGTAHAYYVGIESAMPAVPGMEPPLHALCVAPFGLEEGSHAEPAPQELGLVVGEPVRFRFFGSATRRDDAVGQMLERWQDDELVETEEIEATVPPSEGQKPGEIVPVRLQASITPVGTLMLEAISRDAQRFGVELNVRHD